MESTSLGGDWCFFVSKLSRSIENKLVVFGGYGGQQRHSRLNDVVMMDVNKNEWERPLMSGSVPCDRLFHSTVVLGKQIFLYGGRKGPKEPLGDMYVLSLENWKWSRVEVSGTEKPSSRWRPHGRFLHERTKEIVFEVVLSC